MWCDTFTVVRKQFDNFCFLKFYISLDTKQIRSKIASVQCTASPILSTRTQWALRVRIQYIRRCACFGHAARRSAHAQVPPHSTLCFRESLSFLFNISGLLVYFYCATRTVQLFGSRWYDLRFVSSILHVDSSVVTQISCFPLACYHRNSILYFIGEFVYLILCHI